MALNEVYKIEFLPAALQDMTEIIASFVMLGSKDGAVRIKTKMNNAAKQAASFPYSGVTVPENKLAKAGYRMMIVEKYLMFYRVFDEDRKVTFYRVLNGALNYPNLMKNIDPK